MNLDKMNLNNLNFCRPLGEIVYNVAQTVNPVDSVIKPWPYNLFFELPVATIDNGKIIFTDQSELDRARIIGCFRIKDIFTRALGNIDKQEIKYFPKVSKENNGKSPQIVVSNVGTAIGKNSDLKQALHNVGVLCLKNCLESISLDPSVSPKVNCEKDFGLSRQFQYGKTTVDSGCIGISHEVPEGFEILVDGNWLPIRIRPESFLVSFGQDLEKLGSGVDEQGEKTLRYNALQYRVTYKPNDVDQHLKAFIELNTSEQSK